MNRFGQEYNPLPLMVEENLDYLGLYHLETPEGLSSHPHRYQERHHLDHSDWIHLPFPTHLAFRLHFVVEDIGIHLGNNDAAMPKLFLNDSKIPAACSQKF